MTDILSVNGIRVRFRAQGTLQAILRRVADPYIDAVRDVSFNIKEGETFTLVGESGSGKSTLAMAIAGLHPISEGSIRFADQNIESLDRTAMQDYRKQIAFMWQNPVGSLSPRLSVGSLITEPLRIHGLKRVDLRAESYRLLDMVGLPKDMAERYPHQLSGGQARRVGVARALALQPKLIIADEPTAGLDVSVQGEILNLLNKLQDELGVSMFVITHNLNIVRHISDRTAIMYLGRFVELGETDDIFAAARHPYTLALLSANPAADPDAKLNRIELQGEVPSLLQRPTGCEFHTRCPIAGEHCARIFPPVDLQGNTHWVTCHYPQNGQLSTLQPGRR